MKDLKLPIILAALVMLFIFSPFSSKQCYTITEDNVSPMNARVKLNTCTGETWYILTITLIDDEGKNTGEKTFRWVPMFEVYEEQHLKIK